MEEKTGFWSFVKKKPLPILGYTFGITYLVVKIIDFILNWLLNLDTAAYGFRYNYTVSVFSPVFFIFFFIKVVNYMRKNENKEPGRLSKITSLYRGDYTWRDIYKDRESFAFFVIIAFAMWFLLDSAVRWISGLSSNYAIVSIAHTSTDMLVLIAILLSVFIVVFLQNTVIAWLTKTKQGNKVFSLVVFVFGIITACMMLGISYIWTPKEEIAGSFQEDLWLGMILPVDASTTIYAMITIWLAIKAWKCPVRNKKLIFQGVLIAAVSFIISCTPIQPIIQGILVTFVHGSDALNL